MLLAVKITLEIRRNNDPESGGQDPATPSGTSRHLVAVAQNRGLRRKGAQQKE
jgi:hypothetical protein